MVRYKLYSALPLARILSMLAILSGHSLWQQSANAQEQYELTTGPMSAVSIAELSPVELAIHDGSGRVTRYVRERRYDTSDGKWIGYYSMQARQVIRWPTSGSGRMQIGTVANNGLVSFRESQMSIRASGIPTPPVRTPSITQPMDVPPPRPDAITAKLGDRKDSQPMTLRLVSSQNSTPHYLGRLSNGIPGILSQPTAGRVDWQMIPVGNGMVRLQTKQANQWMALACHPQTRAVSLMPISGSPGQLWRVNAFPGVAQQFALENLLFPGQALTWQNNGLALQALNYLASQQWAPVFQPIGVWDSAYRTVSTQVIPNAPLPPAQVELVNRHQEAIWVIVADRRPGGEVSRHRIPVGGRELVTMDRDTGATLVETYEIQWVSGVWDRQQYTTPIPPATLYDISVHEEFLQSIAIDRTGKSPSFIEDVNYQPRSIGWFLIPPGDRLPERAELDCYNQAVAAGNPGAVRRLDPKLFDKQIPTVDPLKQLLEEAQNRRSQF